MPTVASLPASFPGLMWLMAHGLRYFDPAGIVVLIPSAAKSLEGVVGEPGCVGHPIVGPTHLMFGLDQRMAHVDVEALVSDLPLRLSPPTFCHGRPGLSNNAQAVQECQRGA